VKNCQNSKKVPSAYLLPEENQQLRIYLGSFHEPDRAVRFSEKLQRMGIVTRSVPTKVDMPGEILTSEKLMKRPPGCSNKLLPR